MNSAFQSGKVVAVLATGGTIAGLRCTPDSLDNFRYEAGALPIADLLQHLPAGFQASSQHWIAEQIAQIDSKDMDTFTWNALAQRCLHHLMDDATHGIVIPHGTDTLEETAWFLHRVLPATPKPVILVGAMRPADSPEADGPQNLADALTLAQSDRLHGVLVVHAGKIHAAPHVFKAHPWRLDAFSSGDAAWIGEVGSDTPRRSCPTPILQAGVHQWYLTRSPLPESWPEVAVISSHAQASATLIHALRQVQCDGLVIAGTGNGTIHRNMLEALQQAQEEGMAIRLCSRCPEGAIAPELHDPLPFTISPVSAWKTRIDLALEILHHRQPVPSLT